MNITQLLRQILSKLDSIEAGLGTYSDQPSQPAPQAPAPASDEELSDTMMGPQQQTLELLKRIAGVESKFNSDSNQPSDTE